MEQIPLNHEASSGETNKRSTTCLPSEVVACLENARFLHLATSADNVPHVSLMNYTYLPDSPFTPRGVPVIVMTTNPASRKAENLVGNPNVSLLVHDWVSHRPLTARRPSAGSLPAAETHVSPLATLLLNINNAAVTSSISCTIGGSATLVEAGGEAEAWFRARHLENNTFEGGEGGALGLGAAEGGGRDGALGQSLFATRRAETTTTTTGAEEDGAAGRFVEGEEVRVIVVRIKDVRISDWKGGVRDWVLAPTAEQEGGVAPVVNGIR